MWMISKLRHATGALLLLMVFLVATEIGGAQQARETLLISGYGEEAPVVRMSGRAYIDVENLARITKGSLAFQGNRMVLTLNANPEAEAAPAGNRSETRFSKEFVRAGIDANAALRDWINELADNLQHGAPVENGVGSYRGRALDAVRLASVAASTNADRSGIGFLNAEVNKIDNWTNNLITRQKSLELGEFVMFDTGFDSDALFQRAQHCSQFIGNMLSGGALQEDPLCH